RTSFGEDLYKVIFVTGIFDGSTSAGWNHCIHHTDRVSSEATRDHLALDRATDTTAAPAA
ncbi:hypothetical protein ACCT30_12440, partial [Rhizobium ruizarguesonis]